MLFVGPWMDLWNITEHVDGKPNRHLDRYVEQVADDVVESYKAAGNW